MATIRQCATCGSTLTDGVADGQCPECLIQLGLTAGVASAHDPLDGGFGLLPRDFGDYTLLEEISRGGMGVVFKARQKSLGRLVAVKLILSGHFAGKDSIHRFRTEASSAAALQHPNIVAIHEVGVHQGEHYLAMDLVDGPNLAQFVKNTPLPASLAARYLKTIAEAIHYAHERGILHRDLKPSNILIDAHAQLRVTDFGLAKRIVAADVRRLTSHEAVVKGRKGEKEIRGADGVSPSPGAADEVSAKDETFPGRGEGERLSKSKPATDQSLLTSAATEITLTGQVLGSPNYIAPEQASGKRGQVSRQSDVYSLGAILYHLVTGRGPFVSDTVAETLQQVLHEEPVAPRLLNPGVPRDLETICLKCLQKEPARRYGTARELADELDRFLKDEPIQARPVSRLEKVWRWCRRKPLVAGLAGSIVLLLFTVSIGSPVAIYRINQQRLRADGAALRAQQEQTRAEEQAKLARRESYANMMLLAYESLEMHDSGDVQELLEKSLAVFPDAPAAHLTTSNAPWEWRHLQYETRDEAATVLTGCTNSIHGMAVSPDDQWLAAGTTGGQVLLWHLPTQTLRAEWFTSNTVEHLCFSPDGQKLAVGSRESTVHLLAVPSGKTLAQFRERGRILELRFLANGRRLFFSSDAGHSQAEFTETNTVLHRFPLYPSWRTAISPDLRLLAAAKIPQELVFFRDNTNTVFKDVVTPQYHGTGAAISPDGRWFALGLADRSIELWSLADLQRVRCLVGHTADVYALAWSADSRFLASGGDDQVLRVWNISDGLLVRRLQGPRAGIRVVAFSGDGTTLYSCGSDREVRIFTAWKESPRVDRLDFPKIIRGHMRLAAGARYGSASLGEGERNVFIQTSPVLRFLDTPPGIEWFAYSAIAPNGTSLFAECDVTVSNETNRASRCAIWRQTPSGFVRQRVLEHQFHSIRGHPIFSPDGSRVALPGADGSLSVWQVEPWRELRRWMIAGIANSGILFDSTGNRVVAKIDGRGIFSGEIDRVRTLQIPRNGISMAGIALSADNRFLAIAGDPATIWETLPDKEPERIFTFPKFRMSAASVAFTRDGRRLAIGCGDGQIQIWSFPEMMKVGVLKGHQQTVRTLAFREDDTLVSASPDQVRLWRVAP